MSTKKPTDLRDGSLWTRKAAREADQYDVRVVNSAPAGVTTYRRVIPLASSKPRLCSMKTERFRKAFVKAQH